MFLYLTFGNSNKLLEKTPDKYMQLQSFPGVWTVVCLLYLQSRCCGQLPVGVLSLLSWESGSLQGPRALPQPGRAGEGLEWPRADALLRGGRGVRSFRAAPRVAEVRRLPPAQNNPCWFELGPKAAALSYLWKSWLCPSSCWCCWLTSEPAQQC